MRVDEKIYQSMPENIRAMFIKALNLGSQEVVELFPKAKRKICVLCTGQGCDECDGLGYEDVGSPSRFFYCAKSSRKERNLGLDNTCSVKYIIPKTEGVLCQDVSMALVESLKKVTSELTLKWRIGESGESIMGLCPRDSLSIILMGINRITTSQILHLLMYSPISESIQDVNYEMGNGGNPVASVGNSNPSRRNIIKDSPGLVLGVENVVSEMLSIIKDVENWKPLNNFHPTIKPLALMQYLCRLGAPSGALVLDPFAGSGSTLIACKQLNRHWIGIDIDPEYCDIIRSRLAEVSQTRIEEGQVSDVLLTFEDMIRNGVK